MRFPVIARLHNRTEQPRYEMFGNNLQYMIIFLSGTDTWRSRDQLHKMIAKFKTDRDPQGLNVVRLDAAKQAQEVMGQVLSVPFLAERRMVVIENLLVSKEADLQAELLRRIEEQSLPESSIVVFWEGVDTVKTKAAKALWERLTQEKYAQQFDELKGVKLGGWIEAEVKVRGGVIHGQAVQYLIAQLDSDMWRLSSLLDQLIAYKNGTEIQTADIALFLNEKVDDNIFNLVDAIVGKQPKQVYEMITAQYRTGQDVQYVFAMILRQFRILLEMRDLFEREDTMSSQVMASQLGVHPFVVKKSLPLIRRYTMEQLREVYARLLELDRQIKTGYADPKVLMDVFVGRVCVA